MSEEDQSQFSLMSLEDELTCSICLSTFDCPVTIPCGHNFCQKCLLAHWKDSFYTCPQCRTLFPTKPELKKNTVLSTVVNTFNLGSNKSEESKEKEKEDAIRCDTCMEAEASKTCLTCMASFCEEHLRPHRENPKFSVHQLCEPIGDLSEHLCSEHNKLIEFFCSEHDRPICSLCLQQVHKGCPFVSPQEQRKQKETDLRAKLGLLDVKIERTESVLFQMKDMQSKLKDASTKRKTALAGLYQDMQNILAQGEREAQHELDQELEMNLTKLQTVMERLTENAQKMLNARGSINSLLSQSETLAFLQASFNLPKVVNFDPHPPRINLDSKTVTATQASAAALKEHLMELHKQPAEARLQALKPEMPASGSVSAAGANPQPESAPEEQEQLPRSHSPGPPPRSHSPGRPPIQPFFQAVPVYINAPECWNPPNHPRSSNFHGGRPFKPGQKTHDKSGASQKPFHKQERKPPSDAGGSKPSGKGSDSTKKDHPKGHASPGKPTKGNPQPKKK